MAMPDACCFTLGQALIYAEERAFSVSPLPGFRLQASLSRGRLLGFDMRRHRCIIFASHAELYVVETLLPEAAPSHTGELVASQSHTYFRFPPKRIKSRY